MKREPFSIERMVEVMRPHLDAYPDGTVCGHEKAAQAIVFYLANCLPVEAGQPAKNGEGR